jgi:hypothetical protein
MSKENISQKVLTQIKKEKIEPKSKFNLATRDYLIWLMLFLFLIIGSLATSVVIYMIENGDWDLSKQMDKSFLGFVFATLPYFWLVILFFFVLILYYAFKYTQGGYKYHAYSVIITTILLSIILGLLFYNIGLAQVIDNSFAEKVPFYNKFLNNKQKFLTQPQQGILAGKVVEIINNEKFVLYDMYGNNWIIISENKIERFDLLKPGLLLVLVGEEAEKGVFKAKEIKPLIRKSKRFFQQRVMPIRLNLQIERKVM